MYLYYYSKTQIAKQILKSFFSTQPELVVMVYYFHLLPTV